MIIGLLQCDDTPEALRSLYGNYPDMVQTLLQAVDPDVSFRIWRCHEGEIPDINAGVDAWITTGSKFGANDTAPWIQNLTEFIRQLWREQQPLVGICFGHQLIARALGGQVERSTHGWGVGAMTHDIEFPQPWMTPWNGDTLRLISSHQDQVTALPEQAVVLATSEFCPIYMMQVGNVFLGLQGHPEFSKGYAFDLIEMRRDVIPSERAGAALLSLRLTVDDLTMGRYILNFMRYAKAQASTPH